MVVSDSTVLLSFAILISFLITVTCITLLLGFYRSKKLKRSSTAIAALIFSNGLIGAVCVPMWVFLMYGMDPSQTIYTKLHIAYNFVDITLLVATTLQLLLISYEQFRIKAQPTFNNAGSSTSWSLLMTWILGFVAAVCQCFIHVGTTVVVVISVFILIPFILIALFFIAMLFTKGTAKAPAEQQCGATTKMGLTVLSCGLCLIPCMLATMLFHLGVLNMSIIMVEILIFLRYLNVFLTTIIHGYKSVDFRAGAYGGGDKEQIILYS